MSKKLYYITTEITPFANPTGLGDFSVHVPLRLQEKGMILELLYQNMDMSVKENIF